MMSNLQPGALAPPNKKFCPYGAVAKFPYKYLRGDLTRLVADNYFAYGAFQEHSWTIYYVRTLLADDEKPLLLIPEEEVAELFAKISKELEIHVTFPNIAREPGFQLTFYGDGTPCPRYLGKISSDCSMADLQARVPAQGSSAEEPEELEERSFPLFRSMMLDALQASKNKSKAVKDKKRKERAATKGKRCAELKRTQTYLGLRSRVDPSLGELVIDPNLTYEEETEAQHKHDVAAGRKVTRIDLKSTAPYPFYHNVVFVCVDIEVFEKNHRCVTEIGVCTLDTLDLINVPPGEGAKDWRKLLRPRHFRVVEYAHMVNSEFVSGCPDRFEFGNGSEWISIEEVPQTLASCFKAPFSEPGKYQPYPDSGEKVPRGGSRLPPAAVNEPRRNVILVGHNIAADIQYMRSIGYDVGSLPNVIEAVDTASLFRAYRHEWNPRSLGAVLLDLGLTGWNLHNAGNDATYTMQALLGISVSALTEHNDRGKGPTSEQIEEVTAEAEKRLKEEVEEWTMADEEGGDGGDPVALLPAAEAAANAQFDRAMKLGKKADERREMRAYNSKPRPKGPSGKPKMRENVKPEGPSSSMAFDEDAVDEAMGMAFVDNGNPKSLEGGGAMDAAGQMTQNEDNATRQNKHAPHNRQKQQGQAQPNEGPQNSEKITSRLRMLDMN